MQNIRMSYELRDRARDCADEVNLAMSEWCRRAITNIHDYAELLVELPDELRCTTRSESVPVAVDVPPDAKNEPTYKLREAIACAVLYCESRRPPPFFPHTEFYKIKKMEAV